LALPEAGKLVQNLSVSKKDSRLASLASGAYFWCGNDKSWDLTHGLIRKNADNLNLSSDLPLLPLTHLIHKFSMAVLFGGIEGVLRC